jgi:hypothetical protein
MTLENYIAFIKAHHTIIVIVLAGLLCFHFGEKYFDHVAVVDDQKAQLAQQKLQTQVEDNQALAQTNAALQAQVAADRQSLDAAMKSRQVVVVQQQKSDQALPLPDLASRWAQLVNLPPSDFQATPTGIVANVDAAHATVNALDSLQATMATLKDTQTELANDDKVIGGLQAQIVGLNKQIADADDANKKEIAALKADCRKGKMKWFKVGFVTGFVSGLAVGHVK